MDADFPYLAAMKGPPSVVMERLRYPFWLQFAVHTAATLKLADVLADGPKDVKEIAQLAGTHEPSTYRLLRALASNGVFVELENRRFANTPLSDTLRSDADNSVRDLILFRHEPELVKPWLHLTECVRTGELPFVRAHGETLFPFLSKNRRVAEIFDRAMTTFTQWEIAPILKAYDFSGFEKVVDVAGGQGRFLSGILAANPGVRGVLVDQAEVVASAKDVIAPEVLPRCEIVAANVFEEVPGGADGYVSKRVFHDFDDDACRQMLRAIHRASKPGTKLLIIDPVIRQANTPQPGPLMDLQLWCVAGGRQRTEQDFAALFSATGFRLTRVIPVADGLIVVDIVEAVRE